MAARAQSAGPLDRFNDLQKQGFMKPAKAKRGKLVTYYEAWLPDSGGLGYQGESKFDADMFVRRYGGSVKKLKGRKESWGRYTPNPARQITDRAKRYRAQNAVTGPKVCVICGKKPKRIDVMHLTGNEDHGEQANLAYGCRSCNQKLAAAFKTLGLGRPTNQYNPSKGVPTFQQYSWAVANQRHSGDMGEHGAVIHATPKKVRTDYAKRILREAGMKRRAAHEERWNPSYEVGPIFGQAVRTAGSWDDAVDQAQYMADEYLIPYHAWSVKSMDPTERGEHRQHTTLYPTMKKRKRNPAAAHEERWNPSGKSDAYEAGRGALRAGAARHGTVNLSPSIQQREDWRHAWADFMRGWNAEKRVKGNPASASAEVYEEFHGHAPVEVVTVTKKVHVHEHLAAAGTLRKLVVIGIDNREHTIRNFGGALLAFNEAKKQLFIEGGDQSLNLEDYGIRSPHEMETLGKIKKIDYHADKHQFRTTNEDGRHVVVKVSRYPDLIYDVPNQQMLFSGGSYTIRAEGIDV